MIYIEVLERYWNPGKKLARTENLTQKELANFHYWLAKEYARLVVKAIDDQRFRYKWTPLSPTFLNYKKKNGYSLGMWEMTGELKNAIRVTKKGNKAIVGYLKKKHEDTNLYYVELAKILEFGSIRIPPRPLFRLIYRYMSSNINYFYIKYSKEVNRS